MAGKLPDIELLYLKAIEHESANDTGSAAGAFGDMAEKYPEDSRGWLGLANIYYNKLGDLEKAEEYYKKAVGLPGASAAAFLSYSDLLLHLNRFAEMNAMVNKAMEITGVSKSTGSYKVGLLKESQGNFDDAIDAYRKAILASFSGDEIDLAEKSILRCQVKKKYS